MRLGITVGQIGKQFRVLALPDQHVQQQRQMIDKIILADGNVDGEHIDRVLMFETPAVKDRRFKPQPKQTKRTKTKAE